MAGFLRALCVVMLGACVSGFTVQPPDERLAQDQLPESDHPMWQTLAQTEVRLSENTGLYTAKHPDAVQKLIGQQVTISGFILPLEPTEEFRHFILSSRTPTCGFCPPGEPNEIIEVFVTKPTDWKEDMVTVTGRFELTNQQELGMFFVLKDATFQVD